MKPTKPMYDSLWMSPTQVARYLDLHPMTVYKLLHLRKLPAAKVGGKWRIHQTQLDEFIFSKVRPAIPANN